MKHAANSLAAICIGLCLTPNCSASLFKWVKAEVIPTIQGKRPLNVDPTKISVNTSGKTVFQLGPDNALIRVGDVTIKTHQLQKRLTQAGCTIATHGNVAVCAPDVLEREIRNATLAAVRQAQEQHISSAVAADQEEQDLIRERRKALQKQWDDLALAGLGPTSPDPSDKNLYFNFTNDEPPTKPASDKPSTYKKIIDPKENTTITVESIERSIDCQKTWQQLDFSFPVLGIKKIDGTWFHTEVKIRDYTGAANEAFDASLPYGALLVYIPDIGYALATPGMTFPSPSNNISFRLNIKDEDINKVKGSLTIYFY